MGGEKRRTILLVEDEALIAIAEKRQLEASGFDVVAAGTGEAAILICEGAGPIDLVLMDIDLGKGMDGTEAARLILKGKDIPILFLSSHLEPEVVAKTESISSFGYVVKNAGKTVLVAAIKMAFRLSDALKSLRQANESLRLAQESSHAGTWDWDISNGSFTWSPEFLEVFGLPADTKAGFEAWTEAVHPEDREGAGRKIQEAMDRRIDLVNDYRIVLKGGEIRWIRTTGRTFYSNDRPTRMIGLCMDITERKRMEEALGLSELDLKQAQSIARIGNWKWDITRGEITWSDEMYRIFGIDRGSYTGRLGDVIAKVIHPEDLHIILPENAAALANEPFEYRIILPDRSVRHIWAKSGQTISNTEGKPVFLTGIAQDITERKLVEEQLRDARARLEAALASMIDAVFISDAEGNFIEFNDAFATFHRFASKADCARTLAEYPGIIDVSMPDGSPAPLDLWAFPRALRGETATEAEYGLRRKDTGETWIGSYSFGPIRGADGRIDGAVVIARDITERKRAEEALRRSDELFLREVHHRIKNNMNTVMSMLRLQARAMREPSAVAALEDAEGRMQSMCVLYDRLYRSESLDAMSVKEYLSPLIDAIIAVFPNRHIVTVELHIDEFILPVEVLAPLGIMVNEMITNSMKHAFADGNAGVIRVSASILDRKVKMTFADDGPGIPASTGLADSSGFGLRLIRGLAKQIGGRLRVEREAGSMIVFEFQA